MITFYRVPRFNISSTRNPQYFLQLDNALLIAVIPALKLCDGDQ